MHHKKLQQYLKREGIDAAFFYSLDIEPSANMIYFAQYTGSGALIIPASKDPILVVPQMELTRAKKSPIKNVLPLEKKKFFEYVEAITKKHRIPFKKIGVDGSHFSFNFLRAIKKQLKGIKLTDIGQACLNIRAVKSTKEITNLKTSCAYASQIMNKLLRNWKSFKTESDAAAFISYEAKKRGLEESFPAIVASGKNASMPHYTPQAVKLQKGLCVIDMGVIYKGYCSDITRTVCVGRPNKQDKERYSFVAHVQKHTIAQIGVGSSCADIYNYCYRELGKQAQYFTHGLGHGIGCQIHELPNLTMISKDVFQPGHVFTVEPGVYVPNKYGIRIEDSLLLDKKVKVLTTVSKDLISV